MPVSGAKKEKEGMTRWERMKQFHSREWRTNRMQYVLTLMFYPVLLPVVLLILGFAKICKRIGQLGDWLSWKLGGL
jgi:hypothetical protein